MRKVREWRIEEVIEIREEAVDEGEQKRSEAGTLVPSELHYLSWCAELSHSKRHTHTAEVFASSPSPVPHFSRFPS